MAVSADRKVLSAGRFWLVSLGLTMAFACLENASAADRLIGRAAAVRNQVEGVVNGAARPLAARDPLLLDQGVRTGAASTAQLLFLDETSMNVGPNSNLKLDRFVYDPDRSLNDIALSSSKGIFRFVSGSSDPRSYHLKTPVATIGVRGTIYDTIVSDKEDIIILVEGKLVITLPDGREVVLDKVGQALRIKKGGHVEGPFTWDGTIFKVTGIVPYPLFGDTFLPSSEQIGPSTTSEDLQNILDMENGGRFPGESG